VTFPPLKDENLSLPRNVSITLLHKAASFPR